MYGEHLGHGGGEDLRLIGQRPRPNRRLLDEMFVPRAWDSSTGDYTRRAEARYRRRHVRPIVARMATPRDIKDRIAKRLFRHPRLVRDMLGAFVPAEWTAAIDLDSLRELPAEFINEKGDKRLGDLLLLAGAPGGAMGGTLGGVPTLVMVEHQSAPIPRMAARMMTQTGMLYESLTPRARNAAGRLPPLLAVVVYTGAGEWRAATDLAELAGAPGDAGAGAMAELAGRRYVVLDSRRLAREHPPERNRMTVFVRLTYLASAFEAWEVLAGAREWLDLADEEERSLYQCYVDWLGALAPEHRPEDWDPEKTRRVEELMEEVTAFQRNTERAIERYRREGMELEKARSAERERSLLAEQQSLLTRQRLLLARLASRRFGDAVGRRLGAWLAGVSDPAVFDKVGDLIVGCATGEELLDGIDETPAGDL